MNPSPNNSFELSNVECPACGSNKVSSRSEVEHFQYGDRDDVATTLSATIQVHHCETCDFTFTLEDASEAKHDAVCRHLHVLTPKEVRQVREQYSLSQADFSEISRIGKASLARWESGILIQNLSNDSLLYLLSFQENISRLRNRSFSPPENTHELAENVVLFKPKFKAIPHAEIERLQREAEQFDLYREAVAL